MSRDWTPRQMYEVEKYNIERGLGSWWDFMENSSWSINGEEFPLCTPETIAHRREYPCLGRLYEEYDKLYSFLSQTPGGLELLARHDKELSDYIETGEGDKESPLIRWFEGTLDENFYYRERNDELLMASIQDEVAHILPNCNKRSIKWYEHKNRSGEISWWTQRDQNSNCFEVKMLPISKRFRLFINDIKSADYDTLSQAQQAAAAQWNRELISERKPSLNSMVQDAESRAGKPAQEAPDKIHTSEGR